MPGAFWTTLLDMVQHTDYIATFADPARKIVDIEPYIYSIDGDVLSANITATAAQTFLLPMYGDNDFIMIGINGFGRIPASTAMIANPAIMVQIIDQSSARSYFAGPMPMPMIAGQGGFPYLLTGPRTVHARASLKVTAQSAQVQSFNGFYMSFLGARIWYG